MLSRTEAAAAANVITIGGVGAAIKAIRDLRGMFKSTDTSQIITDDIYAAIGPIWSVDCQLSETELAEKFRNYASRV